MMFESVRWGLPNVAAIIAMAVIAVISFAGPDQKRAVSSQLEIAEFLAPAAADFRLAARE